MLFKVSSNLRCCLSFSFLFPPLQSWLCGVLLVVGEILHRDSTINYRERIYDFVYRHAQKWTIWRIPRILLHNEFCPLYSGLRISLFPLQINCATASIMDLKFLSIHLIWSESMNNLSGNGTHQPAHRGIFPFRKKFFFHNRIIKPWKMLECRPNVFIS